MDLSSKITEIRETGKAPIILGLIIAQLVVIIVIISLIINSFNSNQITAPTMSMGQLQNDNIPTEVSQQIDTALYQIVRSNSNTSATIPTSGAIVRGGSFHSIYLENSGLHVANFIIDIPEMNQSYGAYFEWIDGSYTNDNDMLYCLSTESLIYDNFSCQDNVNNRGDEIILQNLAKRYPFDSIGISASLEANGLKFTIFATDNQSSALQQVKDFISSLGFNPDNYAYSIPPTGYTNFK